MDYGHLTEKIQKVGHPSPFPRELPKRCIKLFSFIGDKVLDPFAGSGTALIEAINHQRKALGLEINEKYIKISQERIKKNAIHLSKKSFFLIILEIKEKQKNLKKYLKN